MIILDGKNLGERQKQLNNKVNDAARNKVDFNLVKEQDEKSDVDKLFKIDLAIAYKNVEYILEVLKCGDSLYISRVLEKCFWLYDIDLKEIVNDKYLAENVFPLMSIKMRNKTLTAIATNLKKGDTRAIEFCAYCMMMKLYNNALKFLILTPTSFKLDVIIKKTKAFQLITHKEGDYLKHFIGDSFILAENYIKSCDSFSQKTQAIHLLKYMYSLSNEKYLDMVESCDVRTYILGRRLSKHIIQNYKPRVMNNPLLYVNALNKDVLKRYIKIEEAQVFAVALLPETSTRFFCSDYYHNNKFILDFIPLEKRFTFIKKIFSEKYKGEPFETSSEFYSYNFFDMMTVEEKEAWALQNIVSGYEMLGSGNDYKWYRFINFKKAFNELKKEIMRTTDYIKRCEMLKVLIDSAKNEEDLTTLLVYFSDRHRNETPYVTHCFLSKLMTDYKVWCFGEDCWKAFEKILYNIDVFDKSKYQNCDGEYRVLALMYYVLNEKSVPEVLNEYLEMNVLSLYLLSKYIKDLKSEKDMLFKYIVQYYTEQIKMKSPVPCEENMQDTIRKCLENILDMAVYCDKTKDDLPDIVLSHINLDRKAFEYQYHKLLVGDKFSSGDIMRYLKKDAALVVTKFPEIKSHCESSHENINWLIRKLKVYFSHDISEKYLMLFNEYLSADSLHYVTVDIAVRGIFVLADLTRKIEFLDKFTPTDKIMDKATMSTNTLDIQKAICRQMLSSRPPLPLAKVFPYITGDYVQHCLVLFRSFLVNLPQPQCLEFILKMINSPISIQKHGLRLAFECVETEKLQMIVLDCWKKTKNVSLRMVLYKHLSVKISEESGDMQLKLFDVLLTFTKDLNENDDETLKLINQIRLPDHLIGQYLEAAWTTVSKFSDKLQNFSRMENVIKCIENKLCLVSDDFIDMIVNEHVRYMLDEEQIIINKFKPGFDDLLNSKWNLTISSLAYMNNHDKLEKNKKLARHIIKKCTEMWNKLDESGEKYVVRHFLKRFVADLDRKSCNYEESFVNFVTLIRVVEQDLLKVLPEKEIYHLIWQLRASSLTKNVISDKETLEPDDIKKLGIKLGKDFGILIKESVGKGTFFRMFSEKIKKIVITMVENFGTRIGRYDLYFSDDILILFCLGLLEHEIFETYMLALTILPLEYKDKYLDAYLSAIKKIQAFQNTEIQYYMYEKFINTDFKKRNFIN